MNDAINKNNISYWYPILKEAGVPTPETTIIEADFDVIEAVLEQPTPESSTQVKKLADRLISAGRAMGFPIFIRTGYGAAKHHWRETCFCPVSDYALPCLRGLVEWAAGSDPFGGGAGTWAVRKYIPMQSDFAAFNGIPVCPERRYFVREGKVICRHEHWTAQSIDGHTIVPNWRELLDAANKQTDEEIVLLTGHAEKVAAALKDGAWSVDFCKSKKGDWYVIDVAEAHMSYHQRDCQSLKLFRD